MLLDRLCGGCAAKYDVAISTACGPLDFVVVDTTNTAQQCVELLRRKQLGVATFLILVCFVLMTRNIHDQCCSPSDRLNAALSVWRVQGYQLH